MMYLKVSTCLTAVCLPFGFLFKYSITAGCDASCVR